MTERIKARIMKDNQMKAVHDDDLKELLISLNVYTDVINHKYKCLFCERDITFDNIDSIVPHNSTIQFTCDNPNCHLHLIGWRK